MYNNLVNIKDKELSIFMNLSSSPYLYETQMYLTRANLYQLGILMLLTNDTRMIVNKIHVKSNHQAQSNLANKRRLQASNSGSIPRTREHATDEIHHRWYW